MKVHFLTRSGPHLASYRLRTLCAHDALEAAGNEVTVGPQWVEADVHVFAKHWDRGEVELAKRSPCAIYDVCDEHFTSTPDALAVYPWIREHYRQMCEVARVVTTGSEELGRIIREKTGREAVVIEEPPEGPECEPEFNLPIRAFWFGHRSNLKYLEACDLDLEVEFLTNPDWTPERQEQGLRRCNLVLLPQGERWKSANRAVTALRAGRFAVADDIPSYEGICWTRGVREGVEWVKQNPGSITEKIRAAQGLIRERFSPKKLSKQWCDCIWGAANGTSRDSPISTCPPPDPCRI